MKYIVTIDQAEFIIDINDDEHVQIDGETLDVNFSGLYGTQLNSLIVNGRSFDVDINEDGEKYQVMLKGAMFEVVVQDERTRRLAGVRGMSNTNSEISVKAPMPGVVVSVAVTEGQAVAKGDLIVVLESMKMQNEFKSPKDGVIRAVKVSPGQKVDQQAVMVAIG